VCDQKLNRVPVNAPQGTALAEQVVDRLAHASSNALAVTDATSQPALQQATRKLAQPDGRAPRLPVIANPLQLSPQDAPHL
jgi:hypothetical protein